MNKELPCLQCKKPTTLRWSFDIDLPAVPFCSRECALLWWIEAGNRVHEERIARDAKTDE